MKLLKVAGIAAGVVIVAAVAVLTIGIPSGFVTSAIQERVERESGYKITVGGATRVGLWPTPYVTLRDVSLQSAADRDQSVDIRIDRVRADVTLESLFSGEPHVTDLTVTAPVLRVPLLRERTRSAARPSGNAASSGNAEAKPFPIDRVVVNDGTLIFSNPRDRVEDRVDGIQLDVELGADRQIDISGSARSGDQPLKLSVQATAPANSLERQTIPVKLTFDAPGLLRQPLSSSAEIRINGSQVLFNGVSGNLGDSAFNGWASADLTSKPLVKVDLDFQRLDLGSPSRAATKTSDQPISQPWSDRPLDLLGLNYLDAQVRFSAAELNIGDARFAPAAVDATLAGGALKAGFSNLGVYGGQANGTVTADVSSNSPVYALRTDLTGVRALPLLSGLADFDKLDGKMLAKLDLHGAGSSPRAIMASLDGAASVDFRDGAIQGLNLARMIRSLTASTLSGWQENKTEATDLSQLTASFRVDKGQATTTDLVLVGPLVRMTGAGTFDLANKAMGFRVEPKLVMTTEGQGGAANPVGLGIPVIVQGPWIAPSIYPDMAGMLDNPDAAYAKLREMGKGLFGSSGAANDPNAGKLGDALGSMIQQGLSAGRKPQGLPGSQPQGQAGPDDTAATINGIMKQLFGR